MCNLDKDHEKLNGYSDAELNEEKKDGNRFKLIEKDPWDTVEEKFPIGSKVRGVVSHFEDDGAFVELEEGVGGFVHRSEISWVDNDAPKKLLTVGEEIDVVVLAVNKEEKAIFLSIKRATKDSWEAVEEKYPIGLKVRGVVSHFVADGAFVKIGQGFRGLVRRSEISWEDNVAPKKLLTVGEEIDVVVLAVNKEEKKIFLSIKRTKKNPWDTVEEKYPIGSKVRGVVCSIEDDGALVELEDGVNDFVHISKMYWIRDINHPSEFLTVGEEIDVVVLAVNKEEKKISLSIKKDPWDTVEEKYPVDSKVRGVVCSIESYGALVEFEDGVKGFLDNDEMYQPVTSMWPMFPPTVGQKIDVVILEINKEEKKIFLRDSRRKRAIDYHLGQNCEVRIKGDWRNEFSWYDADSLWVLFDNDERGLLPKSEVSWTSYIDTKFFSQDRIISVRVIKERSIHPVVSYKRAYVPEPWAEYEPWGKYEKDSIHNGVVIDISYNKRNSMAFVKLDDAIVGFLPIKWPIDYLKYQSVKVRVTEIDIQKAKILLEDTCIPNTSSMIYKFKYYMIFMYKGFKDYNERRKFVFMTKKEGDNIYRFLFNFIVAFTVITFSVIIIKVRCINYASAGQMLVDSFNFCKQLLLNLF